METRLGEGAVIILADGHNCVLDSSFPCRRKEVVRLTVRNGIKSGKGHDRERWFVHF